MDKVVLAIDLGASNGRGIVGKFDGSQLTMEEVYRFGNNPMRIGQGVYWNYLQLYQEVINTLIECRRRSLHIDSIAIDTWAQDYALFNRDGRILGAPHSYRDTRTEKIVGLVNQTITPKELFAITGMSELSFSTMHQLVYESTYEKETFENADKMLFMPSLFNYMLCGEMVCDYTIPSIGHLIDIDKKEFSEEICETLGIGRLLPRLEYPGTVIGKTNRAVYEETGYKEIPVVLVGGHDTASAIAAIPEKDDFMFISSGTWSMFGITGDQPYMNEAVYENELYNTLAANGKVALLKGITGMYIIQQCMREWRRTGLKVTYEQLAEYALANECEAFFDIDDVDTSSVSMVKEVARCITKAGGLQPQSPEEYYLSLIGSLSVKYDEEIRDMEKATGRHFDTLYIVGGGAKASALNAYTARLCKKRVVAGLYEATATGNILYQLQALNEINDKDAYDILKNSCLLDQKYGV